MNNVKGKNSQKQQKTHLAGGSLTDAHPSAVAPDLSETSIQYDLSIVKQGVDLRGIAPLRTDLTDQAPHLSRPTQLSSYQRSA